MSVPEVAREVSRSIGDLLAVSRELNRSFGRLEGWLAQRERQEERERREAPRSEGPMTPAQREAIADSVAAGYADEERLARFVDTQGWGHPFSEREAEYLLWLIREGKLAPEEPEPPSRPDRPEPPADRESVFEIPEGIGWEPEESFVGERRSGDLGRLDVLDGADPGRHYFLCEDATASKVTIRTPNWGSEDDEVHFYGLEIQNEPHAIAPVMQTGSTGSKAEAKAGVDWTMNPAPQAGLLAFHGCHFSGQPGAYIRDVAEAKTGGREAPAKMFTHAEGRHDLWLRECSFEHIQEHNVYEEWVRRVQIENCRFGACGGSTLQFASRRGRATGDSDQDAFWFGNPFHLPAGLDGWAIIRSCLIDDKDIWSREASAVSFFGFLGPVWLLDLRIRGSRGGIVFSADSGKGAYLEGTQLDPPVSRHYVPGDPSSVDPLSGFAHGDVYLDEIDIEPGPASELLPGGRFREQIMLDSGRFHIGRFRVGGDKPAIVLGKPMAGGEVTGYEATFYDRDSVEAHLGRIYRVENPHAPKPTLVKLSEEELEDMTA